MMQTVRKLDKIAWQHSIYKLNFQLRKTKVNYESAMKQIDLLLPEEFIEPTKHALNMCKDSSKFTTFSNIGKWMMKTYN